MTTTMPKVSKNYADNLRRQLRELEIIVHNQNLYLIATGERFVNPHISNDGTCIMVDSLYREVSQQFMDGRFRNANGYAVYIS